MKYGQQLKREAIPEWEAHYLNYKVLKKCIKAGMLSMLCDMDPNDPNAMLPAAPITQIEAFVKRLEPEVKKVEHFFQAQVNLELVNVNSLETSLSALTLSQAEPCAIKPEQLLKEIGMVLEQLQFLEKFARQNEEGLRKIVKKFNKLFFTQLSAEVFCRDCSFQATLRETPLVSIRTGANNIHGSLLRLVVKKPHPLTDRALMPVNQDLPVDTSSIDLSTLQQYFHLPLKDVAKQFGMCVTVFKRVCRACGIKRWPARKVLMVKAKKAKLCKRIGINEEALAPFHQAVDPTGEAMLEQLQQAALNLSLIHISEPTRPY
eukprot:TRINITY_DN1179_c0_g1_i1.p1 TRINITY_DN1179_c0_g1~~TRINITY_DN1179_c0_g1_i1.p1  ORF type:complete len:318 (-),score=101.08 TRINITY_DN1179_c0_g1_i1:51-1004(-)